ncbi:6759_t:CDS:2 [Scutellospora calospora]|uniref:6759_t:CDS:1 n=1 Tax=Scutellospora calospora TaxID=85575 RepID=A0ACA9MRH2_9GLOM|nr:6759_t:CDS:2 [Scutellospora calospora]
MSPKKLKKATTKLVPKTLAPKPLAPKVFSSETLVPETFSPAIRPFNDFTNNLSLQQQPYLATQQLYLATQQPYSTTQYYTNSLKLNEPTSRYNEIVKIIIYNKTSFSPQPSLITRDQENLFGSVAVGPSSSTSPNILGSTSTIATSDVSAKLSNRWSSSETRMLIEEVGKQQQALQRVKDPREKGRIWDKIITNIQTSEIASLVLKERTKASIQQKWDSLLQKYRDIKDRIASTGEEPVQNNWEFFNDIDEYLRKDPSVTAPITSDSLYGVKRKSVEDQDDDEILKNEEVHVLKKKRRI